MKNLPQHKAQWCHLKFTITCVLAFTKINMNSVRQHIFFLQFYISSFVTIYFLSLYTHSLQINRVSDFKDQISNVRKNQLHDQNFAGKM